MDMDFILPIDWQEKQKEHCKDIANTFAQIAKEEFKNYSIKVSMEITKEIGNYNMILNCTKSKFRGKKVFLSSDKNEKVYINVEK